MKKKGPLRIIPFIAEKSKPATQACLEVPIPRPVLSNDISIGPTDDALYHHARKCITSDFEMTDTQGFWQRVVLPLSHINKPIKSALCALGGAHRMLLETYSTGSDILCYSHSKDIEVQAMQKYNELRAHRRLMLHHLEAFLENLDGSFSVYGAFSPMTLKPGYSLLFGNGLSLRR